MYEEMLDVVEELCCQNNGSSGVSDADIDFTYGLFQLQLWYDGWIQVNFHFITEPGKRL